jgi:hypothetical protein
VRDWLAKAYKEIMLGAMLVELILLGLLVWMEWRK